MSTSTASSSESSLDLVRLYEIAARIQRTDDRFIELLSTGQLQIHYYSPKGQELIAAATGINLSSGDYVVSTYRGLHDHVATGVPLKELWAEFAGKETGTCKGKGGPMHMTHPESGLMVTTGVVGAGLPIANGLALASAIQGDGKITVCNFGDGATNTGAFHEALNLASLWSLPVVFVCQNNRYGEKTALADHTRMTELAKRADAYDMPGTSVDGNNAEEVWDAMRMAIDQARKGGGPSLVEARTFRLRGHFFGDDSSYMPEQELAEARDAAPVPKLRNRLLTDGHTTEAHLAKLESQIDVEVNEAMEFAMASPYPGVEELHTDVYAGVVS